MEPRTFSEIQGLLERFAPDLTDEQLQGLIQLLVNEQVTRREGNL